MNDLPSTPHDNTAVSSASRGQNGRVLVVDGVEGDVRLAASVLEPEGYRVSSASNGRDALATIERHQPDLILPDAGVNEALMDEPRKPESRRLHSVRNHLSVIIGYCDLLLSELPEQDSKHKDVLEMRKAAIAAVTLLQEGAGIE